jgi:hypothetical protein
MSARTRARWSPQTRNGQAARDGSCFPLLPTWVPVYWPEARSLTFTLVGHTRFWAACLPSEPWGLMVPSPRHVSQP